MNTSVSPGRKLPWVFCHHITFTPYFYRSIYILWNKIYFSEALPECLNWLTKQAVVFKFCSSLEISSMVLVKILSAIRICYCNIPFFVLPWPFWSDFSSRLPKNYYIPMSPSGSPSCVVSLEVWKNLHTLTFLLHLSH